ncbi:unnamed protein product [Symbiodinium microadriaticum]|nr:unnamed protein product [Symbiodinium sp. KB8]CAE7877820.1 unnamed protein product [Symbiodinium microadriaticum]
MVLLTLAALAAGAAGAGVTWSRCGKKSLGRQMKGFAESLISKALAGSSCKLGGIDFKISGCEMQIGVSGVEVGNLPPYKSESLLKIASVYLAETEEVINQASPDARNAMERGRQTDCMDAGAAGSGLCPRRHPQPPTRTLGPDMFPPARGEPTPTASTAELTGPVGAHSRSQTVAEIEKNMTPEYRSQKERMHQRQEARLRRDSPLGSRRGCRRLAELAAKQAGAERSDALRLTPTDGESAAQGLKAVWDRSQILKRRTLQPIDVWPSAMHQVACPGEGWARVHGPHDEILKAYAKAAGDLELPLGRRVNLQSLLRSGFKQVIIEELLVDGLQLTVEKIHLTTNNVKELLHKITEEKSDQSGETQQPTNQSAMGALPQGMPTLNTVAGGVSNAADGMVKLGKATATRVAAIGQPAKKHEPKDSKVCLKKVEVRSIVVHSVSAMMSDNKTPSLSLKAPPIRFLNFSESHGIQNAADMIQLLLKEILGSASRVVSDLAKDSASSAGSYLGEAASTISQAATSVGGALGGVMQSSADSVCVFWNWLSQPALPSK